MVSKKNSSISLFINLNFLIDIKPKFLPTKVSKAILLRDS